MSTAEENIVTRVMDAAEKMDKGEPPAPGIFLDPDASVVDRAVAAIDREIEETNPQPKSPNVWDEEYVERVLDSNDLDAIRAMNDARQKDLDACPSGQAHRERAAARQSEHERNAQIVQAVRISAAEAQIEAKREQAYESLMQRSADGEDDNQLFAEAVNAVGTEDALIERLQENLFLDPDEAESFLDEIREQREEAVYSAQTAAQERQAFEEEKAALEEIVEIDKEAERMRGLNPVLADAAEAILLSGIQANGTESLTSENAAKMIRAAYEIAAEEYNAAEANSDTFRIGHPEQMNAFIGLGAIDRAFREHGGAPGSFEKIKDARGRVVEHIPAPQFVKPDYGKLLRPSKPPFEERIDSAFAESSVSAELRRLKTQNYEKRMRSHEEDRKRAGMR